MHRFTLLLAWALGVVVSPSEAQTASEAVTVTTAVRVVATPEVAVAETIAVTEAPAVKGSADVAISEAIRVTNNLEEAGLPVTFARFEAVAHGRSVRLAWTTATETGNAGFAVERRVGEGDAPWTERAWVPGAGTTGAPQTYAYEEPLPNLPGSPVRYRLRQVDADGRRAYSAVVVVAAGTPADFALGPSYPNPFADQTRVTFDLPRPADVRVVVYDALGREVARLADGPRGAGRYTLLFDATSLAGGLYFVRLDVAGRVFTRSVVRLR